MSYELLRSLYFGETTNADIVSADSRRRLHVRTGLDNYIPTVLRGGHDLVLSGNPGDGKSHLVRYLQDIGALGDAVVELDLSARPTADVIADWLAARQSGKPFALCANQGPLGELIRALAGVEALAATREELAAQLGNLTTARREQLPQPPRQVSVIDLADRNLIDQRLIQQAIARVCAPPFWPNVPISIQSDTSAGRNLNLVGSAQDVQDRLARILVLAGQRAGAHFTFRHVWGAIAYALTAGKRESTLQSEYYAGRVGLDMLPLGYLTRTDGHRARNPLVEAVTAYADPILVADPRLDEELWFYGKPRAGRWLTGEDLVLEESPARLWERGDEVNALERFKQLKRAVALAHSEGEHLITALEGDLSDALPSRHAEGLLLELVFEGLQRLYLTTGEAMRAPSWLSGGVPLWVSNTYQDIPGEERPHVAVGALTRDELRVLKPTRVPWLDDLTMGPPLEVAWLEHRASGITLRLEPGLLAQLHEASASEGPMACPERVQRFLVRVAGWQERQSAADLTTERFAVLERPRGALTVYGSVLRDEDRRASYGQ